MTEQATSGSLRDYVEVVRRRKWTVAATLVLFPLLAVAISLREQPRYSASADVLLSRQNLATSLNGIQDPTVYLQADRVAQTDADVARSPTVAERTLAATRIADRTPAQLLGESSVTPKANADLLTVSVTDRSRSFAVRLASEYAKQFTVYRRELDTAAIAAARHDVVQRLGELAAAGQSSSSLYSSLAEKEQQLATMEALQAGNAFVVRPALTAKQVAPRPVRDGVLGGALGLVIGLGLAFLWEALDTRVRAGETISDSLGMPLLARIPGPTRRMREENELAMLQEPTSPSSEAYRTLRANVEFVADRAGARRIMVTSATVGEGKSTTAANLAVALARVGHRVALVDLDFRRPALARFFELDGPGVTHVALGRARLGDALVRVPLLNGHLSGNGVMRAYVNGNGNGSHHPREERDPALGSLSVLGTGSLPPDPGEFTASSALRRVLREVADESDIVLVDAPPLLSVGDALAASDAVDGLLVVSHLTKLRRPLLAELKRVLDRCPAPPLGFVVTGADVGGVYDYRYGTS